MQLGLTQHHKTNLWTHVAIIFLSYVGLFNSEKHTHLRHRRKWVRIIRFHIIKRLNQCGTLWKLSIKVLKTSNNQKSIPLFNNMNYSTYKMMKPSLLCKWGSLPLLNSFQLRYFPIFKFKLLSKFRWHCPYMSVHLRTTITGNVTTTNPWILHFNYERNIYMNLFVLRLIMYSQLNLLM